MFSVFTFLDKNRKLRMNFTNSEEYAFFLKYRPMLIRFPMFKGLFDSVEPFNIFRADIVIQGLLNKEVLDHEISELLSRDTVKTMPTVDMVNILKDRMIDQPYYLSNKIKVFLPFFPKVINLLYLEEPRKLAVYPYKNLMDSFTTSIVDPFDTYGPELFNSYFTRLFKIKDNGKEHAFFHYDFHTIYIVNLQGRLDHKIVLFDRFLKNIDKRHMLERLNPVVDAYFANDKQLFIENLYKSRFISEKMLNKIKTKSEKRKL